MMPRILSLATLGTALGCGLVAGAFFVFSTFVMKALGSLPPSQAVRAMQAINVAAPTGLFRAPTKYIAERHNFEHLGCRSCLIPKERSKRK